MLDEGSLEYDFLKEALGQVLGTLVVKAFSAEVTIDRFPVFLEQIVH
jgi:hypothetical protein